jgi:hypothetical protein
MTTVATRLYPTQNCTTKGLDSITTITNAFSCSASMHTSARHRYGYKGTSFDLVEMTGAITTESPW